MEKDRTRFTDRIEIVIDHANRKVERTVSLDGEIVYLIKSILNNHRDIELYKRAITDIVLMLDHKDSDLVVQRYKDIPEMSYIIRKIRELKSFEELKPTQYKCGKRSDDTP